MTRDTSRRDVLRGGAVGLGTALVSAMVPGCKPSGRPGGTRATESNQAGDLGFEGSRLVAAGETIGHIASYESQTVNCLDTIEPVEPGVFRWERRFTLRPDVAPQSVRLTLDFIAAHRSRYSMIPAISYNGNPWGSGSEPRGFARDGTPWSFAFHRCAIPGGTYSEGDRWAIGLWAKESIPDRQGACSLIPEDQRTIHRLTWPEEEQPVVYSDRDDYSAGIAHNLTLQPGESFTAYAYLFATRMREPRTAWRQWLDASWKLAYRPMAARYSPSELWALSIHFASELLWAEEGVFKGFSIGLRHDGQTWYQRNTHKYEIGWAGQNASLACSLLEDHRRNGVHRSREKGLATLDTWVQHGRFANGLIYAVIDPILGLQRTDSQDACNLGSAAADFFKAYELARECGSPRPAYLELALGICDFMVDSQQANGCYGRAWRSDGTNLGLEGTIGAFIIPGMLAAYSATERQVYLDSAERAYRFYHEGFTRHGFTTAGALDTDCIDKESAWPLMDGGLALHDITGDRGYVTAAETAAYYTATWQYHHTVPTHPDGMLTAMEYDSFGGTAVSTQHHHLDPWAVRFVPAYMRLAELSGNEIWAQRAEAAWCNGMMGLSDGTLELGGVRLPRGTQCEGYFHTRWQDQGNASLWLVAWPAAFRLEVLRGLSDWSVLPDKEA